MITQYSKALFRTLKYTPTWPPKRFESLDAARQWVKDFVHWYNHVHRHSSLKVVTPAQRHNGEDTTILAQRKQVYELAKERHPERWSGNVRNWQRVEEVWLNPPRESHTDAATPRKAA